MITAKICFVCALIIGASSMNFNGTRLTKDMFSLREILAFHYLEGANYVLFSTTSSAICIDIRQVGGQIDSEAFRRMPTASQTILMLTRMPKTVGVREVNQLSYIYLTHLQNLILYEANVCEKSPAVACERIWALLDELTMDAATVLPVQQLNYIEHPSEAIISLATLNNVVEPFVEKTKAKLREVLSRCEKLLLL